jgi:Tfp pilus assembly PilM family ATPase
MSGGLLQTASPDVAVDITAGRVTAVRLSWRGQTATVAAQAVESLPPGAVVPALAAPNMPEVAAVARVVREAVSKVGGRVRRVALVIPDTVVKVSLVRFEQVPARAADLHEMIRWQMRKSAPFPMEQAIVSFTAGAAQSGGAQEFVVSTARRDIIEEYEGACAQAGLHAGLVDIATFSLINGVLGSGAAPSGDWLLVHTTHAYTSLAVLRGSDVIYFRNRAEESEGTLADDVHQTAMYYEDRLKGAGFTRVLLTGGAASGEGLIALRRSLEDRLRVSVEAADSRSDTGLDRATSPAAVEALAPLIGILLRDKRAA